jgi:site-specific DNA-methyltransferase (adenine-specific)
VYTADALDFLRALPDNSVALIATDPPYYRVKNEPWDRAWDNPAAFLDWISELCTEWQRVLKSNGSLYVFASPQMSARVECRVAEWFSVLNRITWRKPPYSTKAEMFDKDTMRTYFPASEAIIFVEHYNADNAAKGEAGYAAKCDELRGFVFEPLRAYLDGERRRAGIAHRDVITFLGMTGHDTHFFSRIQWKLPLEEQYLSMRQMFNRLGRSPNGDGEYLRREYEGLRREYENLRRPFTVSADVPYTDVWDFPTVQSYPGKHPCEKPLALMEHIIAASSRPGDVVLDCFAGHGTTLVAARNLERRYIGCDASGEWVARAKLRLAQQPLFSFAPTDEEVSEAVQQMEMGL